MADQVVPDNIDPKRLLDAIAEKVAENIADQVFRLTAASNPGSDNLWYQLPDRIAEHAGRYLADWPLDHCFADRWYALPDRIAEEAGERIAAANTKPKGRRPGR